MIRAARQSDSKQVVELIHNAIGTIGNTLAGTEDDVEMIRVLENFFVEEGNRLSYQNTIVKELDGCPVGFLLAYHGSQSDDLDRPILARLCELTGNPDMTLDKEANEDEYYLDSIAVHEDYQGRGIAKELMRAFEQKGVDQGYKKLSLLVDKDNPGAHALYEKMGYKGSSRVIIGKYDFLRMIKEIG